MGSIIYDYLSESVLFDEKNINNLFKSLSNKDMINELAKYREFCLKNHDNLQAEVNEQRSKQKGQIVFSGNSHVPLKVFNQTAFYAGGHIISDPLFKLSFITDEFQQASLRLVGVTNYDVQKHELCKAISYLKNLSPMVAYNYVKLLPLSRSLESSQPGLLEGEDDSLSHVMPPNIRSFLAGRAKVLKYTSQSDGGGILEEIHGPCREIAVEFEGSNRIPFTYRFHERVPIHIEGDRIFMKVVHPEHAPDSERFSGWIKQSISNSIGKMVHQALADITQSEKNGALYFVNDPLIYELLQAMGLTVDPSEQISAYTLNSLLQLEVPIFENATIERVLDTRNNDGEAFENFRDNLDKGFRELRTEEDEKKLKIKRENLMHDLTTTKMNEIKTQIVSLRKKAYAEIGIAALSLTGTVQTAGLSFLPFMIASLSGFKTYEDYKRQVKLNPAYFLYKVQQKSGWVDFQQQRSFPGL